MKFVVDTNIAFSAVLNTESKIGDLIMNSHGVLEFHACDTLRSELKKHRLKLLEFSKMSEEQLDQSIYQITDCLHFTNEALIPFEFWVKAANLVRDIDMNDIAFVTLAEFLDVKLWTGDVELIKGLAKKGYSNFITTDELHKLRTLLE
ncbi:MAG: PIN domain-containing protein [Saprospiraceae bacterium]